MLAGAGTVLVLSVVGGFVVDSVRSRDEGEPQAAVTSSTVPADQLAAPSTLVVSSTSAGTSPSTVLGATAQPAETRPPIVTFQADGGQATATGAVPSQEVSERIATTLQSLYGPENVVVSGVVVDPTTDSALWMDSVDELLGALSAFDDHRIRFDGETMTGFVGGGEPFESGATALPPGYENLLQYMGGVMTGNPSLGLLIEGHTDSDGEETFNLELSQARAEAVQTHLAGQGIDAGRTSAVGKGETNPAAPNDTAEGKARNRRVELTLTVGSPAG